MSVPSPDTTSPANAISTFGWDVAFVATFAQLNAALGASGSLPTTFAHQLPPPQVGTVWGQWASWTLVGGAPSNQLWINAVVGQGTLTTASGQTDISGSTWTVQFSAALTNSTTTPGGGTVWHLTVAGGVDAPVLVGKTQVSVTGPDLYVLEALMGQVLLPQVASLDLSAVGITTNDPSLAPDQPWLMPTAAAFACESLPADDERGGIYALLAMTESRSPLGKQLLVDTRILDGAPDGTTGAWLLGPTLLTSQFLLPAAQALVQGSDATSFSIDPTGLTVYNNATMTWGSFSYGEDTNNTAIVTPQIPQGNLELSLDGAVVHLSLTDINFPNPAWAGPGQITIAFDAEQFITFAFVVRSDGGLVMVPDSKTFNSTGNITIIPDKTEIGFQIALDAVTEVLMAFVGGAIEAVGEGASEAMEAGTQGGYNAEFDEIEMEDLGNKANPDVQQTEEEAADQAGDALANGGDASYVQQFKSAIIANRWKILATVVEKMVTFPVGKVSEIALWVAEKDYDKLPTLQPFVAKGIAPVRWPGGATLTPTGGSLEQSLLIWGKLTD
ncbi:TULIP family P47-like protein [Fibrella aquatilis]|uniref:TULIP family P47-like protein n=1 Tax=Fibrella aquatilis TaxID=2817059 RepID=A0A939G4G3_9BACT|nr:TULIP family P47-like protein [Fibrella aquatilis]MBO0930062.1 TULIP family P47-like protein [Fibrella aquatilis]